ncbi:MAG: hypothetical protein QG642_452 [Patescibacteria group bacterium]|nr:hypothetical protein [Patescibacteria group bacterium]
MEKMEDKKEDQVEATQLPESEKKVEKKLNKLKKLNKKTIIILAIVIVLGVLLYLGRGLFIAATVNGQPISRWSVITMLEKESGKSLLESMVIEKIIAIEAKSKNVVVSDEDVSAEIKKIEADITAQGGTLELALAQQGLTLDVVKKQILLQKQVEKLLADKIVVSDEDIAKYITDNQVTVPAGQEATFNEQIKADLVAEKLNTEAQAYIAELKEKAKIKYFVNY